MYANFGPGMEAVIDPPPQDGILLSDEYVMRRWRSLYEYADSNPASLTDPSGLAPCTGRWRKASGGCCEQRTSMQNPQVPPSGVACSVVGAGPYNFTPACVQHDICYSTCASDRYQCDYNLWIDAKQICIDRYRLSPRNLSDCFDAASVYYYGVRAGGNTPYQDSQDSACVWMPCDCGNISGRYG
ncbi:MAG TPA: hypothetical protein VHZ24_13520 [Pirellulales bacterium]|jgi:hypothetical protein|nr:hypothetical protein [Pirellulales bacterium]